jgi:hypothetical protein
MAKLVPASTLNNERTPWRVRGQDLIAALIALAVPTFATIFATDVATWTGLQKWGLISLFVVAAIVLLFDGIQRDKKIDASIKRSAEVLSTQRQQQRSDALSMTLKRICNDGPTTLKTTYTWTVFIYDAQLDLLVPWWPAPDLDNPETYTTLSYEPGQGATGEAWSANKTIVRTGSSVHDGNHRLNEAQQKHNARRNTVVATPIYSDDNQKRGVLSGVRDKEDPSYNETNDIHTLRATASVIGTLMVTYLQLGEATSST